MLWKWCYRLYCRFWKRLIPQRRHDATRRDGCSSIRTESCHSEATIAASNLERSLQRSYLEHFPRSGPTSYSANSTWWDEVGRGGAGRGAGTVLKNLESALNRLNGIPSYETFLSREHFFQNSWFTRHSAWIMFRLPEITRDLSRRNIILLFPVYAATRNIIKSRRRKCIKSTNGLINSAGVERLVKENLK